MLRDDHDSYDSDTKVTDCVQTLIRHFRSFPIIAEWNPIVIRIFQCSRLSALGSQMGVGVGVVIVDVETAHISSPESHDLDPTFEIFNSGVVVLYQLFIKVFQTKQTKNFTVTYYIYFAVLHVI